MLTAFLPPTTVILIGDRPTWRAGPHLWSIWTTTSIGALLLAISASLVWLRTADESQTLRQQIESDYPSSPPYTSQLVAAQVPLDFTHHFPSSLDVHLVVIQLQRSCSQASVELASVQIKQQAATIDSLARTELNITLRGNYPAVKTVLAEVMGRYSNISLRRLSMRSSLQGQLINNTETETTAVLALWGAPANPAQNPAPGAQAH